MNPLNNFSSSAMLQTSLENNRLLQIEYSQFQNLQGYMGLKNVKQETKAKQKTNPSAKSSGKRIAKEEENKAAPGKKRGKVLDIKA